MRKMVRLLSEQGPEERLGRAIAALPPRVQESLALVAAREDLPLVAGSWQQENGGCLVANAVAALEPTRHLGEEEAAQPPTVGGDRTREETLDLRILELLPELSSRDLNHLIVAWDEAADQDGRSSDAALRRLLRGGLARAGVAPAEPAVDVPPATDATGARVAARQE